MHEVGCIHIGDMINVMRHGSLVMQNLGDSSTPHTGSILYGTVHGAIGTGSAREHLRKSYRVRSLYLGMVTQLPPEFYAQLEDLQNRMKKHIRSVGKIGHSFWRSFYNERKSEAMEGFVDGDLIETFLDLNRETMEAIVAGMHIQADGSGMKTEAKVEDIIKIVEDLTRIH